MAQIQVTFDGTAIDGWLALISREFPDAEFRLLASQVRDDAAFVILAVLTPNGTALVRQFENTPEVDAVTVYHTDERRVVLQFQTTATKSYDPLRTSKTISIYPTILRDGWFSVEIAASQERLAEYIDELAAAGLPYEIVSLVHSHTANELLTERQWEFITEAIERGFYASPRECTLTELGDSLGIHRSAVSRLRHRAESRIIRNFVAQANRYQSSS